MLGLVPFTKRGALRSNGTRGVSPLGWNVDRLFDRLLDDSWFPTATEAAPGVRLEMVESDDKFTLRAEVPGVAPDDLDISLTGELLTLSGEKKEESETREGDRIYSERTYGSFQRTIQLPCAVDADSVEAEHENGVVIVTLKKAEAVRPKRINVRTK